MSGGTLDECVRARHYLPPAALIIAAFATRRAIANFNTVDRIGLALRCGNPQETFRKQAQSFLLTLCVCPAVQHFQHWPCTTSVIFAQSTVIGILLIRRLK